MPTGSRSMAVKYSQWIIAAPVMPSSASLAALAGLMSPRRLRAPVRDLCRRPARLRCFAAPPSELVAVPVSSTTLATAEFTPNSEALPSIRRVSGPVAPLHCQQSAPHTPMS